MNPKIVVGIVVLTLLAVACSTAAPPPTATPEPPPMSAGGMAGAMPSEDLAPPVRGLYEGEELLFFLTLHPPVD